MNNLELLASVIRGDQVRIEKVLEKYTISEKDKDLIMNTIDKIIENTYELVKERITTEIYKRSTKEDRKAKR